jgi:hypothetical protein
MRFNQLLQSMALISFFFISNAAGAFEVQVYKSFPQQGAVVALCKSEECEFIHAGGVYLAGESGNPAAKDAELKVTVQHKIGNQLLLVAAKEQEEAGMPLHTLELDIPLAKLLGDRSKDQYEAPAALPDDKGLTRQRVSIADKQSQLSQEITMVFGDFSALKPVQEEPAAK